MTRRRIKKAQIQRIALVPRGANKFPVLYKSDDNEVALEPLSKLDEEKGELTAVVYAPEVRDSQGDIASADVVKQMAHDFVRNGAKLDLRHEGEAIDSSRAYLAETFIIQKGDERFADWKDYDGNPVQLDGGWAVVLKIDDPELRKLYREGKWNGVSMAGPATVEFEKQSTPSVDEFLLALAERVAGASPSPTDSEIPMNQEELKKLLQDSNQELAKAILDGLTAALKKDAPADGDDDPKPVDISKETDPQKLLDYAKQRRIEVLKEDFDLENADADEILEFQKALQAIEDEFSQQSRQLRKAKRPASRQRASDGDGNPDFISQELTKEEQDLAKAGLEIGKLANKISGRA